MNNFTILRNIRMASDVVDGPGWTDDVNDVNDSSKPQSKAKTRDRTNKSTKKAKV